MHEVIDLIFRLGDQANHSVFTPLQPLFVVGLEAGLSHMRTLRNQAKIWHVAESPDQPSRRSQMSDVAQQAVL
jgi:hypothetical protein